MKVTRVFKVKCLFSFGAPPRGRRRRAGGLGLARPRRVPALSGCAAKLRRPGYARLCPGPAFSAGPHGNARSRGCRWAHAAPALGGPRRPLHQRGTAHGGGRRLTDGPGEASPSPRPPRGAGSLLPQIPASHVAPSARAPPPLGPGLPAYLPCGAGRSASP